MDKKTEVWWLDYQVACGVVFHTIKCLAPFPGVIKPQMKTTWKVLNQEDKHGESGLNISFFHLILW